MAKIAKQLTDLLGHTPLLELNKFSAQKGLQTPVIAKVEFFNPGGSVRILQSWRQCERPYCIRDDRGC